MDVYRLVKLDIPVPPPQVFEKAIGYVENERYLALNFDSPDEIYYEDAATWDLGNVEPFDLWANVIPWWRIQLDFAHIRYPDKVGVLNWLLLDRQTRNIFYGPKQQIIPILARQLPMPGRAGRPPWAHIRADVIIGLTEWYSVVMPNPKL